jgi:hypothetical protein
MTSSCDPSCNVGRTPMLERAGRAGPENARPISFSGLWVKLMHNQADT